MSKEQVINHYIGKKRTVYQNAAKELRDEPLNARDLLIRSFVKAEKWNMADKGSKPPRMIQARSARFNLALAQYHKPVEHIVYRAKSNHYQNGIRGKHRIFAKCRTWSQRAKDIAGIMKEFKRPLVFSTDCRRYDAHVTDDQLRESHKFYSTIQKDPQYLDLLTKTRSNKGRSANGVKYRCKARRMSGDDDTACGNSVIMAGILFGSLPQHTKKWAIYDDGDNCLVFIEDEDAHIIKKVIDDFAAVGHELAVEGITSQLEDIVFCQMRIVALATGYTMCPDINKIISGAFATTHVFQTVAAQTAFLRCQAQSLLSMTLGMPVLSEYAHYVLEKLGPGRIIETFDITNEMEAKASKGWRSHKFVPITDSDYGRFEHAFGYTTRQLKVALSELKNRVDMFIPLREPEIEKISRFEDGKCYSDQYFGPLEL